MICYSGLGNYGRLGNQMFQLASTIGLSKTHQTTAGFPQWKYAKYFRHQPANRNTLPARFDEKLVERQFCDLPDFNFSNPSKLSYDIHGYLQSQLYFNEFEDDIVELFQPKLEYIEKIRTAIPELSSPTTCTIHVRRGDYANLTSHYVDLSVGDYYQRACSMFPNVENFIVFSDDIDFCRGKFSSDPRMKFFQFSEDILDMFSMSLCRNNISSNSTFSWWASFLNSSPSPKVVSPNLWFQPILGGIENSRKFHRTEWCTL